MFTTFSKVFEFNLNVISNFRVYQIFPSSVKHDDPVKVQAKSGQGNKS